MTFSRLASFFAKLESTTSRNAVTEILADLFREAEEKEIDKICYLALGELVPPYRGLEFNIAEKMLIQIIERAYGVPAERILTRYKTEGDLGNVAESFAKASTVRPRPYTVTEVYERLLKIATESGAGSQERKIESMATLLTQLEPLAVKFVVRIPAGKLRLGFSDATLLDALSLLALGDKSGRAAIERAFNVTADIGEIARRVKRGGIAALTRLKPKPGVPIRPSLAERIPDPREIIQKLGPRVAIEPKLDGFRTAIHVWTENNQKRVALFSRNLENTTHMFPEIVAAAKKLSVKNAILDGEAIGYDPHTGRFTAFQETVQRKRKYGVAEMAKKIPLAIFVFDILYVDDRSLLEEPFSKRRSVLERVLHSASGAMRRIDQRLTDDPKAIEEELHKAVRSGLEGIVVKNLQSPYEAGSRGFHWVKFKPTSAALGKIRAGGNAGLPDTIDCVVMGAYKGKGKRAAFGVGGFLLGVRGRDEKYYTISRLGSGLSDEDFREMFQRISTLKVPTQPHEYVVAKETIPDIWIRPSVVVEILSDEITLSPRHTAGRENERGYSLRFPRLVRFREDKNPEDATTVAEVKRMYRLQRTR